MTLLKDLIDIPESAAGDVFVLNLQDGVRKDHASETLHQYVITPAIAERFDEALDLIRSSLGVDADNRPTGSLSSKGAYLHGSFGSGKSHFMAILHLLLEGNQDALARRELAKVVARHRTWMSGRRFLLVTHHMIGAKSVESAVYENYLETVAALHPEASPPDLYDRDAVFEAAERQRGLLGDDRFLELLNAGADPDWGDFGDAGRWTIESYRRVADGGEGAEMQRSLATRLGTRVLPGEIAVEGRYTPLADGLELISGHANGLGYDAVVLFLDEFVLWLASRGGDSHFVAQEMEKAVKLVDAGHAHRPVPIVSFIARQRSLQQLIAGRTGSEEDNLEATMSFHEARFKTIELMGTELPEIVSRRLLTPRDHDAKRQIDRSFDSTIRSNSDLADTLSGNTASVEDFAKVYPFSPVLIDALVHSATMLQRDRTALKAMLQILVSRRESLALGELIPAGDLYDVVKDGNDAITDEFRKRFRAAKTIYETKFIPMLERNHGTTALEIRRRDWNDPLRIKWRRDDRLFKTILLAALVPAVPAFCDLKPITLVRLNHGSVTSLIRGQEAAEVLQQLRRWSGSITELTLAGDDANPTVTLAISGVDVDGVVRAAQAHDTHDARRQLLKRLVYEALEIEDRGAETVLEHVWKGTHRKASIVYQNVGSMNSATLENHDESWKIVIDYPIDEEDVASAVASDHRRIEEFRNQGRVGRTIVWRPRFLNKGASDELGRLAILERLAARSDFDKAARHLSIEERDAAWPMLESQRNTLRQRITGALQVAYGLSNDTAMKDMIDESVDVGDPFESLDANLQIRPPGTARMRKGLVEVLEQALESQFPAAPVWERVFSTTDHRKALEIARTALQNQGHRASLDQATKRLMQRFADPLGLGETTSAFVLKSTWKEHFDREAGRSEMTSPTVADLRTWMDRPAARGLPRPVQDLLILIYADHAERAIHRDGTPLIDVEIGGLRDDDRLVTTPLPSQEVWTKACDHAGSMLGAPGRHLHPTAAHVAGLAMRVREAIGSGQHRRIDEVHRVLDLLTPIWAKHGIEHETRERELKRCIEVLERLSRDAADDRKLIETIADLDTQQVGGQALGAAIKSADETAGAVERANWPLIDSACLKDPSLRDRLHTLLATSELARSLRDGLRELERDATRIVTVAEIPTPPPPPVSPSPTPRPSDPADDSSATTPSGASPTPAGQRHRRLTSGDDLSEFAKVIETLLLEGPVDVSWRQAPDTERPSE